MATKKKEARRILDARPDTLDFRDKMYVATLMEVPIHIDLSDYRLWQVPILDQGNEGACTGFGLATVANYLLRKRRVMPDDMSVSPRMFYEMAKRYDEWPGEDYEGSSARGAMKGWHKHGVCAETIWPYDTRQSDQHLNDERVSDASRRPLGAYYRVNHKDLVAMHTVLAEVGILYATAVVHEGWNMIDADGIIPPDDTILGGHAFAIVAYDGRGFWIQNSWGVNWGREGFALITYDDWLEHGTDVWVARLGAPVTLRTAKATATSQSAAARQSETYAFRDIRPHIISIGNDGLLRTHGTYGTSEADVASIFREDFPRITEKWRKRRILLYAHGGLTNESSAIQRVADYRTALLEEEVYPLAFIWKTDFWTTLTNILKDAVSRRRPEGFLDATKDFMLNRLDDALEPMVRMLGGKLHWDEMKENAVGATVESRGGARIAARYLTELAKDSSVEIHVAGHSAGGIFHAPLVQLLAAEGKITSGPMKGKRGYGLKVASCTLWAPACTTELFKQTYLPVIQEGNIGHFTLFTLTDDAEQDDHCASVYNKSLLYLVSNALEDKPRIPLFRDGEALLGMEKFVGADDDLVKRFDTKKVQWILSPNNASPGTPDHSTATSHGDFDDDKPTLRATLARILQEPEVTAQFTIHRSASSLSDRRKILA
ncbi:MAG: peptidase C1 [Candidatus Jettenia sp.]|uniref:Peptidase n=1 Tax=Candidatus Jettenia caeni TaxID=247490 RepID=I3INY1_9BACT|nr:C1 family peptidase [Candidatus Jettenia sp. AMX1]MBC6927574.1 peptidase C1 [Candidatus Jettenia sp.]GAB63426.1 peptidase [Candidatus Jettenia caeni]KAA0251551.1 MAG: peptidase C1 [Candidatus Jettenia sp. AMX1]MCE7881311.1 peptidase C1 [Candidatus Jettenia sp. AMX1]MCQ3926028.1 peptidase C1 [Candidatus Jettenia sp.]